MSSGARLLHRRPHRGYRLRRDDAKTAMAVGMVLPRADACDCDFREEF